jgi:hypothetical protein
MVFGFLFVFQAKEVVKTNHLSDVITVLHGRVEVQLRFKYHHLAGLSVEVFYGIL